MSDYVLYNRSSVSCAYTIWVTFVLWLFCHQWTYQIFSLSSTTKNKISGESNPACCPLWKQVWTGCRVSFFFFLFLDAVIVGRDLTRWSGCRTHRWPVRVGGKKHWKKYWQSLLTAQLLPEHQQESAQAQSHSHKMDFKVYAFPGPCFKAQTHGTPQMVVCEGILWHWCSLWSWEKA